MATHPDLLAVGQARPMAAAHGHLDRVVERSAHVAEAQSSAACEVGSLEVAMGLAATAFRG